MTTDDSTLSRDKKASPELLSLIKAAATNLIGFGELWNSIKKKGKDEGFSERELQDLLRPMLKPQLNKDQIYYLFNADKKKEYGNTRRNIPTVPPKKDIEDDEIKKIGEIRRAEEKREAEEEPVAEKELEYMDKIPEEVPIAKIATMLEDKSIEDPKDLEIQFLKEQVGELHEALKKTEQFVPATNLQLSDPKSLIEKAVLTDENVFEWLRQRENRINIFYYDNYGIDLVPSRLVAMLKNAGVKTFKRLYFEV